MTDIAVIENKISAIQKYLATLGEYKKFSREAVEHDTTVRGAVERYLYLVAQAVIDLSEKIVAVKQLRKPTTMRESFQILEEARIITTELAEQMTKLVGFRNTLAHEYASINYDIVYDVLQNRLVDIENFTAAIRDLLRF